jgi:PHD/YefM family antitoxin component YafN of YafNO toxin-antitoxin module
VIERLVKDLSVTHLDANQACRDFSDTLERVSLGKERIVLQNQGHDVAVLVPLEDLSLLERLEDLADVRAAEAAEAAAVATGETPIPWEEARRQLGL